MPSTLPRSSGRRGVLERYADFLPLTSATPRIDLGEGSTPLVRSSHIGPSIGIDNLYFKLESSNPTGSFKDRGMVLAVAKAMEEGAKAVLCASTGNTSASAAAYAAHCGLAAYVFLPKGGAAIGKLAQSIAYGAQVVAIQGTFDDALRLAREFTSQPPRRAGQLRQRLPHPGPEDGRLRDRRRPRRRAGQPLHPRWQRRQHHRLLGRLQGIRREQALDAPARA